MEQDSGSPAVGVPANPGPGLLEVTGLLVVEQDLYNPVVLVVLVEVIVSINGPGDGTALENTGGGGSGPGNAQRIRVEVVLYSSL